MLKSRTNPNSPKPANKTIVYSKLNRKKKPKKRQKRVANLKTFKLRENNSNTINKSYRMASPQHKRKSNFGKFNMRPFYSPNIRSNKASKIASLFGAGSEKKFKDRQRTKVNTFQERLDRFKVENKFGRKNTSKSKLGDDENDSSISNFEKFSKESRNTKKKGFGMSKDYDLRFIYIFLGNFDESDVESSYKGNVWKLKDLIQKDDEKLTVLKEISGNVVRSGTQTFSNFLNFKKFGTKVNFFFIGLRRGIKGKSVLINQRVEVLGIMS